MEQADGKHPCPVCGRTVFSEAFEICPICGWENSGDESIPEMAGGANGLSFNDYCMEYRRKIAADPAYTWVKECDEQSEKKGIFWIVDRKNLQNNEPYLFRIPVDPVGVPSYTAIITTINRRGRRMFPRNFAAENPIIIIRAAGWRSKRRAKQKYFSIRI